MNNITAIFLFDVDGVIVNPLAYRAGIAKTLQLLLSKVGLSNIDQLLPSKDEIAHMEACGVHDVWDITNIIFASVLCGIRANFIIKNQQIKLSDKEVVEQLLAIAEAKPQCLRPDYVKLADNMLRGSGIEHPPDVALDLLSREIKRESLSIENNADNDTWIDLLCKFLVGTRNAYESYGTRLFQNIILGSDEFAITYGLKSEYDGPSLLRTEDIVLINSDAVGKLTELNTRADCRLGIYTARPSHPPSDIADLKGYSPEAEIALEAAGLQQFPLVAMGMMEWLAKQHNERPEDLTKPNTTQAIAALIGAIAGANDSSILEDAYKIDKENHDPATTALKQLKNKDVTVYVFEDTTSGIKPLLKATERLNVLGYSIKVKPLGIANDKSKKEALEKFCDQVFDNVNDAVDFAIKNTYSAIK